MAKHKVQSRILSACWSNDGKFLALGFENGLISLRDTKGVEQITIR